MPARTPSRPVILVSNDDGIHAEGLRALEDAMRPLGRVYTVAPATEQSATSHSITLARPLRLREAGPQRWAVDGTPVDCVYVAMHHPKLLPARPAVVVSGINHGLNLGSDVFYSGTVAAAREGAMRGIPAVAVSMARRADLGTVAEIARGLVAEVLARPRTAAATPLLLNVNVPPGRVRGVRATRLGPRLYDELVEMRTDPRGQSYLWIGGPNVTHPPSEGTDTAAYEAGYASVSPLSLELFRADHLGLVEELLGGWAGRAPRRRVRGHEQASEQAGASARRARGGTTPNGGRRAARR